ncbi:hypothetical protein F2Q69_00050400 [Brassica cretica]|uniref:Uncharacterized protein n=1 Tax=Brassica cretica TaxID=69181 RepID=A0A8S9Q6X3_BRACR|nr:hypothetical protein F2Q69_00050400 [Brassica cretica]
MLGRDVFLRTCPLVFYIKGGRPGINSFRLILSETKDTRPKQRDPPMRTEDPSRKGRIRDQSHKARSGSWRKGPRVQGRLVERRTDRSVRAIAVGTSRQRLRVAKGHELPKVVRYQRMQVTKRLDQKGTSRQRLRVAKGHELPKVVRYQRMQVTKRYEIPRVASIKGYEDQRVPMSKGCIVIPRMQCIVIQDLRSCHDPGDDGLSSLVVGSCFMTMFRWPSTSRDSHIAGGRPDLWMMVQGVGTNLINECIGWYEQVMSVVWVKSQGRPEDGLGTIAYKAKGCRIVHEPRKARCIPRGAV